MRSRAVPAQLAKAENGAAASGAEATNRTAATPMAPPRATVIKPLNRRNTCTTRDPAAELWTTPQERTVCAAKPARGCSVDQYTIRPKPTTLPYRNLPFLAERGSSAARPRRPATLQPPARQGRRRCPHRAEPPACVQLSTSMGKIRAAMWEKDALNGCCQTTTPAQTLSRCPLIPRRQGRDSVKRTTGEFIVVARACPSSFAQI